MGHGKYCSPFAGKLRLAGACLSLCAVLSFSAFLPLAYYVQLLTDFPVTACNDSGPGPPDVAILAGNPRSSDDDDSCTLGDAASELKNLVLCEQPAPEVDYPALAVASSDPISPVSRFKLPVLPPRAPPILL